jgi:uncharacterized protein YndB with AHSA1/START domain
VPAGADPIDREIRIEARPDVVFAYFTDPQKMALWKGVEASLEPRPGGLYRVVIEPGRVARGEFREVVRNQRVVFTWGWEGDADLPPGRSTVEVSLTADGDGTIVRLFHRDLPPAARKAHAEGWDHFLPRLQQAAGALQRRTGEKPTRSRR